MIESLGTISTALGLAGTAVLIWKWLVRQYKLTLGSRQELAERLRQISCGVTMNYVTQLFGTPTMQFTMPAGRLKQVYWLKHAWLAIVTTDQDDPVMAIAIVVTDPKFKVSLGPYSNGLLDVQVGASTFDKGRPPNGWRITAGAHTAEYAENYYLGNAGFYQTYVIANSDAGVGGVYPEALVGSTIPQTAGRDFDGITPIPELDDEAATRLSAFRRSTKPNVLAIVGPMVDAANLLPHWIPVGLHHQEIRMFPGARASVEQ